MRARQALNVVIRMEPSLKYPFNVRSFFNDEEKKDIGGGLVLWRGYFQSVRPAIGRLLINIDISTGCMYKPGRLIDLCLDFLGRGGDIKFLERIGERDRLRLQRFIVNLRVITETTSKETRLTRVVKGLSNAGADRLTFTMRDTGESLTVADYFKRARNKGLQFPKLPCIQVPPTLNFILASSHCQL